MPKKNEETRLESVKAQLNALNEKVHDLSTQTQDYIADHPVKSTLTAFAVGVIAGALLMKVMERRHD